MKLRISETQWAILSKELLTRSDVETAGLLLGPSQDTPQGTVVAVREAFSFPDEAYLVRRRDQISIDPIRMNRLIRRARDRGWSVFTIHTHPGAAEPWFSAADDVGDSRLMPSIKCQIPNAPHGSLVLVDDGSVAARAFDNDHRGREIQVQIVGRTISTAKRQEVMDIEPWFARQDLALGAHGQGLLRSVRVAVIGLGGIGSLVSMQLAHLGIGELVLIDGDIVEASNLSRIVGATKADIARTFKVEVASRYAQALGLVSKIQTHPVFVGPEQAQLLASCDVIISCVDQQTPRALLNRISYQSLVPVIDLGTAFRVNDSGAVIGDAGRVVVIGPDRPCLGCWGYLDAQALRVEALSAEERDKEVAAGYIDGAVEAQPSVVAFNTLVAGAGVVELVRLITAFAGSDAYPMHLAFSFAAGTVKRTTVARNHQCSICGRFDQPSVSLQ